jgi:hypothetical protein
MSVPALAQVMEWGVPEFQKDPIHLASIVGIFALLAYSGIRLRGPRLFTLLLVTVFALQHKRGLGLFGLVAPLLLARPLSTWAPFLGVQPVLDPVARFANRRSAAIATACIVVVTIAAVMRWTMASPIEPPTRTAPQKALAAAKLAGVSGHVLNSYGFGGYLIFNGIPTFVDGRVDLYGDPFLQRYMRAINLTNRDDAEGIIKQYDIKWALLRPGEPIIFMLQTQGWEQLYRDDVAIVLAKRD